MPLPQQRTWPKDLDAHDRKVLQRALNDFMEWAGVKHRPLKVDGVIGPATQRAIKEAKRLAGITAFAKSTVVSRAFLWRLEHPTYVRKSKRYREGDRKLVARGKRRRVAQRARDRVRAYTESDKRWGGSRYFTNRINEVVQGRHPGTRITSRKRGTLLGNLASDHNFFNTTADAIDHALVDDHATKNAVSRALGGPAQLDDYGTFVARNPHNGRDYRVQLIAGTHGTGPHHHGGVRRI